MRVDVLWKRAAHYTGRTNSSPLQGSGWKVDLVLVCSANPSPGYSLCVWGSETFALELTPHWHPHKTPTPTMPPDLSSTSQTLSVRGSGVQSEDIFSQLYAGKERFNTGEVHG